MASAMYRVFGEAHTQWWTGYVDDYGVFGSTKEEAEQYIAGLKNPIDMAEY